MSMRSSVGALLLGVLPFTPAMANLCGEPLVPACPPVPASPVYSAGQVYGFSIPSTLGILDKPSNGVPRSAILDRIVSAGSTYARTQVLWQFSEPNAPSVDPLTGLIQHAYVDSPIVQAEHDDLQARGVKQIMVILGAPYWALNAYDKGGSLPASGQCASSGSANCFAPPNVDNTNVSVCHGTSSGSSSVDVLEAWKAWITHVVNKYPNIAAVEIWNEPNHLPFWGSCQDPALYARVLAAAADAAHAARPGIKVVVGGLTILTSDFPSDYLNAIYAEPAVQGAAGGYKFDAIGVHPYPCNEPNSSPAPYAGYLSRWMGQARVARDANLDYGKPFWVTETGISSANVTSNCLQRFNEPEQQLGLAYDLDWFKQENASNGDVPIVIVHTLFNTKSRVLINLNSGDKETEFGLVAWAKSLLGGAATVANKAAFPTVSCKFKGTC